MKYFVILLLLAGFVFSVASAQYQGDVEFYHLPVETDSKQYSVLSQSITNKFIGVFYDDKASSLIFSISKSADLIDSAAITMNQHSLSELFSSENTQEPNNMLVLINGEEQPYKTVKDNNIVSWVFQIPPNSDEIELIPSSERFGVGNYRLEDVPNNLPKIYPPLKQEHIGITINEIQCKDKLVKVLKKSDNTPACITSESKSKLIQRDWIQFQFSFCGADGFDSKGNLNKSNFTHTWDENYCKWQTMEKFESDADLANILDRCAHGNMKFAEDGHSLWSNQTHKITAESCEIKKRINSGITLDRTVYTSPFGYPRDTTGNYDHCFSYKTDPEYGVEVQNSTHTLNLENCKWELENETFFHGKPLSYWQNLDEDSLVNHYDDFGKYENFFDDLGILLIKSHSEENLLELGIIPAHEIEVDWTGVRPSLPPRMGFDAKVNSTDGKSYRISGTIHGNEILDNFQIVEDNGRRIGWTPGFEYTRVQITGTTALQICSMIEITCIENPVWDAIHRHDKDFTYFYYDAYGVEPNIQTGEHYIQIDKNLVCHSFEDLLSRQISELECQEIRK